MKTSFLRDASLLTQVIMTKYVDQYLVIRRSLIIITRYWSGNCLIFLFLWWMQQSSIAIPFCFIVFFIVGFNLKEMIGWMIHAVMLVCFPFSPVLTSRALRRENINKNIKRGYLLFDCCVRLYTSLHHYGLFSLQIKPRSVHITRRQKSF